MKEENFWKTSKGKATLKLLLWTIFIVIIIIAFAGLDSGEITDNNQAKTEEKEVARFTLYSDMLNELLKNNYSFKYKIKIGEISYIYSGECDGEVTIGLKETIEGITKYYIKAGVSKKIVLDMEEPLENLYENIDTNIIDLNLLFDSVKGINYQVQKDGEVRTIIYDTTEFSLVVTTNLTDITNVKYTKDNIEYNFDFSEIGKIENISYK